MSSDLKSAIRKISPELAKILPALEKLSTPELEALAADSKRRREKDLAERKLYGLYPDTGPLRRELYPKHIAFFAATGEHEVMQGCPPGCDGSPHNECAVIGANRSGKSMAMCYALACHMTGWYAPWWPGRKFARPVAVWVAGEDAKAVRESIQFTLLGTPEAPGTGLIPKAAIQSTAARAGVPDAVDAFTVKHASGGISRCTLKTYDQGRESFQASKIDIMAFDEEPPMAIYNEGLTRTMSTVPGEPNGLTMCAFTPLRGLSDVVLSYMPSMKPGGPGAGI